LGNNIEISRKHEVVFYPNDESFMDGFARFAEAASKVGDPVVIVATESRCSGILARLNGVLDVKTAMKHERLIVADAEQVLATFMKDDMPVAARVTSIACRLIARAASSARREHSRIAVCGELAPTLLAQGKPEAAIMVERLVDDFATAHNLDLLCGYVLTSRAHTRIVERICAEHASVHIQ
jgi:hypothetical protein